MHSPEFARPSDDAKPVWLIRAPKTDAGGEDEAKQALAAALDGLGIDARARDFALQSGFAGRAGQLCLLPGPDGVAGAIWGLSDGARDMLAEARLAEALPAGAWRIANRPEGFDAARAALGWLLAQYRFDRYATAKRPEARLVCPEGVDAAAVEARAAGEFLTRDLINTPACDMGPAALEQAARDLAARHGLDISVTEGAALLAQNLPLIHMVGRAAEQAPRLIELRGPQDGTAPRVTLVGKGVCFDTGGLNLKPGASMGLMKKDMGGAATVLGLVEMIARLGMLQRIRLRVLIPAVENAVAGNAMRPGDIARARNGKTVEINNTDAEGRLVLADALALGGEESPDWMMSFATLTGAARVALGPDLPAFFCDDDAAAQTIMAAGMDEADPVWRLPFWPGYEEMIEPGIADLDNAPSGGMAGAITAALFLKRFASGAARYAHFDLYGWRPSSKPGRPKGGMGQGARAVAAALAKL